MLCTAGGHTAEMLMLVAGLDKAYYTPRVYVTAETDKMSAKRALTCEQDWAAATATKVGRMSWNSCWPRALLWYCTAEPMTSVQ
jgi:hypothetical protein